MSRGSPSPDRRNDLCHFLRQIQHHDPPGPLTRHTLHIDNSPPETMVTPTNLLLIHTVSVCICPSLGNGDGKRGLGSDWTQEGPDPKIHWTRHKPERVLLVFGPSTVTTFTGRVHGDRVVTPSSSLRGFGSSSAAVTPSLSRGRCSNSGTSSRDTRRLSPSRTYCTNGSRVGSFRGSVPVDGRDSSGSDSHPRIPTTPVPRPPTRTSTHRPGSPRDTSSLQTQ